MGTGPNNGGVITFSHTAAQNATADSTQGWAEGMAPSAVNNSARSGLASIAKYRDDIAGSIVTTGSSNAYQINSKSTVRQRKLSGGTSHRFFAPHHQLSRIAGCDIDAGWRSRESADPIGAEYAAHERGLGAGKPISRDLQRHGQCFLSARLLWQSRYPVLGRHGFLGHGYARQQFYFSCRSSHFAHRFFCGVRKMGNDIRSWRRIDNVQRSGQNKPRIGNDRHGTIDRHNDEPLDIRWDRRP